MLVYKEYNVPVPKFMVAEYLRFLPEKDIALFRKYLSGFQGEHYSVQSAFKKINTLNGTGSKLKYVLWMMFPSPKYMMRSYRLENKNWVWLYYPYRFWLGLLGGIRTLRQQKNENKKIRMQWHVSGFFIQRRKRDSNPRYPLGVYTLSRRASSTTRASLLLFQTFRSLRFQNKNFQIASLSEQKLLDRYAFRIKILKFRIPSFISLLSTFIFYFHFGRQRYEISWSNLMWN